MGNGRKNLFAISLLLAFGTLAVYLPSLGNHFTTYDDPQYVTANDHVNSGLTLSNLLWAFTTGHAGNWHPLTWISHMLDVQLYGLQPVGHHLTNVLLHTANTLLLFWTLFGMTRRPWLSMMVAALFAWHPLHVESVAWISERKDVLSTFFFLLTLLSYSRYVRQRSKAFYLISLFCFACGLLSKPMLVTLPCVLLLLDFWPLERAQLKDLMAWRKLAFEKIPFFTLAIVVSVITVMVQYQGGTISSMVKLPLGARMANAFVSYFRYVLKFLWPTDLSVLYVHPGHWPSAFVASAVSFVIGITILALGCASRRPYFLVGWFWFLGTLAPVIGLVQVGVQSMADRYTYIPSIGLSVLLTWGLTELAQHKTQLLTLASAGALSVCLALTWQQEHYWKDGQALFQHALEIANHEFPNVSLQSSNVPLTSGFADIHFNLALALEKNGYLDDALRHYDETSNLKPNYLNAHYDQGVIFANQGKSAESIDQFRAELKLNPNNSRALNNLGTALMQTGEANEAFAAFLHALALDPANPTIHYNTANAYAKLHRWPEAQQEYEAALRENPDLPLVSYALAGALLAQGKTRDALVIYRKLLQSNPEQPQLLDRIAWILVTNPDPNIRNGTEAVRLAQHACELTHNSKPALLATLAAAYAEAGRFDEAVVTQKNVLNLISSIPNETGFKEASQRLELYESHKPFRDGSALN
ncbi:tetratricopeptide repeat protein [Pedosphaera parvula]|uniref:Tetratricopeptide TPR_2 repeat protein n=1 Tax=Pedosphaera parvula (strain Ellin514) TaxID=320771 RepID=B9XHX0_PEDPL|nr:tetratricopeptide repeat protein [Pedosphaera parvula]EEF60463.1 Tetratricopeptide TPR_2 repeat protein [Pedosphaera parvula Ellin514]